jgi:hypothetical protein
MTTTKDDQGVLNHFAIEPEMTLVDEGYRPMVAWDKAGEALNGRLAMIGIIAALGSYAVTGQIIPGIW